MKKIKKLRRIAMRADEMKRRKRMKWDRFGDFMFGLWVLFIFVGCPILFVLGAMGVIK